MNPIEQFEQWFADAKAHPHIKEPTAMSLATATKKGAPSARIVLLKEVDARGFVFYTNLGSRKSKELLENPQAALCFYWAALDRQVRVEGLIEPVTDAEANAYFASRARESQIGAWASRQSEALVAREALLQAIVHYTAEFAGRDVPRPPHWGGWRVAPQRIEFWQQGEFRLHEREVFRLTQHGWETSGLYP